jgi:hypothetical protein
MSDTTALPQSPPSLRGLTSPVGTRAVPGAGPSGNAMLRVVPWLDPIADPHGVHPCSRYVELYWLGIIGPSTTWLLRRFAYGLERHPDGLTVDLVETARSLGLGERMGKNSPFRRAVQRLATFQLARSSGPGVLAVRVHIPPLPLRHLSRLPETLQVSHRRWTAEQHLPQPEQMRRRVGRLAVGLAAAGSDQAEIERQLARWHVHPAVAFRAAQQAAAPRNDQPGSSSWPAGVSPQ